MWREEQEKRNEEYRNRGKGKWYTITSKRLWGTYTICNRPDFQPAEGQVVTKIWRDTGFCWFAYPEVDRKQIVNDLRIGESFEEFQKTLTEEDLEKWQKKRDQIVKQNVKLKAEGKPEKDIPPFIPGSYAQRQGKVAGAFFDKGKTNHQVLLDRFQTMIQSRGLKESDVCTLE